MKSIFAVTIALTLGATPVASIMAQLPSTKSANSQSASTFYKKQTSDPYFSTPAQSAAEQNSKSPALPALPTSAEPQIWKSLSRKTSKPVQRIDFSQLQVNPAVKADLLKTASAWHASSTKAEAAKGSAGSVTIDFSAPAIASPQNQPHEKPKQPKQVAANKPESVSKAKPFSSLAPLHNAKAPPQKLTATTKVNSAITKKSNPLAPLPISNSAKQQPKRLATTPEAKPLKPKDNWKSEFQSTIQQATYQEPAGGSFVPGKNIRKIKNRIQQLSAAPSSDQPNLPQQQFNQGYHVADSSTAFGSHQGSPAPGTIHDGYTSETPVTSRFTGESFEPSRVVAIVGGDPIFVGDMLFEVNQLIEKHMKGAPEAVKVHQRGKLIKRLLPKYVDQKMLFLATTATLPEGADIEDVITQAETTFNEQALPDMMKSSGITSTSQFDANLRAQGSSIRQMRRSWAKDQVGRYLLAEQVKVNKDVTHQELLEAYQDNYDSYGNIAKCRWEKIEIKFSKAGGRFAAKDKMDDIYQRLVHGGNFQAIAKKESHGFKASKGGQHDWTNRGSLVSKKVDEAIFTLRQGTLSEIIETKDSFIVVRVLERVDAYHTPFEETQSEIKKKIVNQRRDKEFKKYLQKIRQEIPVEYPKG